MWIISSGINLNTQLLANQTTTPSTCLQATQSNDHSHETPKGKFGRSVLMKRNRDQLSLNKRTQKWTQWSKLALSILYFTCGSTKCSRYVCMTGTSIEQYFILTSDNNPRLAVLFNWDYKCIASPFNEAQSSSITFPLTLVPTCILISTQIILSEQQLFNVFHFLFPYPIPTFSSWII